VHVNARRILKVVAVFAGLGVHRFCVRSKERAAFVCATTSVGLSIRAIHFVLLPPVEQSLLHNCTREDGFFDKRTANLHEPRRRAHLCDFGVGVLLPDESAVQQSFDAVAQVLRVRFTNALLEVADRRILVGVTVPHLTHKSLHVVEETESRMNVRTEERFDEGIEFRAGVGADHLRVEMVAPLHLLKGVRSFTHRG